MPKIISIAEVVPPYEIKQDQAERFAGELFADSFKDIGRLLKAFQNGQIETRHFVKDLDWFHVNHSFTNKNEAYIEAAVTYGKEAIIKCLGKNHFIKADISFHEIEAIFFISSTGIATPSIEARIMNQLPFNPHTKRIPIWGLGCAGGASGLSRANEYCLAFPKAKVLVLTVELCSLTFQPNDLSKSNLIGTSLFADGISCALICGDECKIEDVYLQATCPSIITTQSTLMPDSLDVMGWDLKKEGLFVVFSRDIPTIIEQWLKPNVTAFLEQNNLGLEQINYFIAHPGGKKVLDAYIKSLGIPPSMIDISQKVLQRFGNMSSATIFYVLKRFMEQETKPGTIGLCTALGPGFSSELLLLRWI